MISLTRLHLSAALLVLACSVSLTARPAQAQAQLGTIQPVSAELGVGDANADVVFTPVPPCRLIDTRLAIGAFVSGEIRNYNLIGPTSYTSIGGNGSGCGIPVTFDTPIGNGTFGNTARALVLSFAAVAPIAAGHVVVWPANQAPPVASVLNFAPAMYAVANGVAVVTCTAAVAAGDPCPNDLSLGVVGGPVHIVVDVLGYYTPQRYVLASNRTEFGVFAVDFPATAAGQNGLSSFSFHPPLSTAPTPNVIPVGGGLTTNCPGTGANPLAAPGYLCVYETSAGNVAAASVLKQLGGVAAGADPIGATYWAISAAAGRTYSVGVWAVTAP